MRTQPQYLLRFLSLVVKNLPPFYSSGRKPVGHHLLHNKSRLKAKGQDPRVYENMAGILVLMDYPWIYLPPHQRQNEVGEVMVTYPPMAIEEMAIACKSIKTVTVIKVKHQYQRHRLIIPPEKMVMRAMAWTLMKMLMRLAAPTPTTLH